MTGMTGVFRSHRRYRDRLLALSTAGLLALLGLGLSPLVASANTGKVDASENCTTWSAWVRLDNNVLPDHHVDVVTTIPGSTAGFLDRSYDYHVPNTPPLEIWSSNGLAPATGTVTLTIHNPGTVANPKGTVEGTESVSIAPTTNCANPSISTKLSSSSVVVGSAVNDSATLSGATSTAGGTVTYKVYSDAECTLGAVSAGTKTVLNAAVPDSNAVSFNSAGTYYWQAVYSGDANNHGGKSACQDETLVVQKAQPGIQTTPSAGGVIGTKIHDSAIVSGGFSPTGTVTFKLYGPTDAICDGAAIFTDTQNLGVASGDYTTAAVGTYHWTATYNGDANNKSVTSPCASESATTTKAQPGIETTPSAGGVIGTKIHDSAIVSGGFSPTGTVTFNLYGPSDATCAGTAVFTDTQNLGVASGDYTTAAVGTYHWTATYRGDANNLTATSACASESATTTKAQPDIETTPSAGGVIGTTIHDSATVSGGDSPTGTVTFRLYGPNDAICDGDAIFTDTEALGVNSADYTTAAVGTYHWTATYNGDANNLTATSACASESATTTKAQPAIQTTPSAGGVIGTKIHDSATVSGGFSPTGTVTFNLYGPSDATCAGDAVFTDTQNLGVASGDYTTTALGTYHWTATYSGDAHNLGATSACADESATVTSPPAGGTLAASVVNPALPKAGAGLSQPGTSRSDFAMRIFLALMLVLAGVSVFAVQAIFSPARNERG